MNKKEIIQEIEMAISECYLKFRDKRYEPEKIRGMITAYEHIAGLLNIEINLTTEVSGGERI